MEQDKVADSIVEGVRHMFLLWEPTVDNCNLIYQTAISIGLKYSEKTMCSMFFMDRLRDRVNKVVEEEKSNDHDSI